MTEKKSFSVLSKSPAPTAATPAEAPAPQEASTPKKAFKFGGKKTEPDTRQTTIEDAIVTSEAAQKVIADIGGAAAEVFAEAAPTTVEELLAETSRASAGEDVRSAARDLQNFPRANVAEIEVDSRALRLGQAVLTIVDILRERVR